MKVILYTDYEREFFIFTEEQIKLLDYLIENNYLNGYHYKIIDEIDFTKI